MDNDDEPVGYVLTRREVLTLFGAMGAATLAGCAPGVTTQEPTRAVTTAASSTATTASTATAVPSNTAIVAASSTATVAPSNTATLEPSATATLEPSATATLEPTATAVPSTATATTARTEIAALPSCVVRPEMTEGPYFVDLMLNHSDIRSDPSNGSVSEGTPLRLAFQVTQVASNACIPIEGALVDVWHCDAFGAYSSATDRSFNTQGQQFLRGYQLTNSSGMAEFVTIYPGWYQGRAVHIHFKIRAGAGSNQSYEFTSQLFFNEAITDVVHAQEPYASKGYRTLLNGGDGIYRNGGDQLLLEPVVDGDGYTASFNIGLQLA